MTRKLLVVLLFVLSSRFAIPQGQGYTNVTASGKTCYANGSVQAAFVNQSSTPNLPLLNGSVFPTAGVTNFDSSGSFTGFYLADNNQIFPTPSQWLITACAKSGGQPACGTTTVTITGPTQDISSAILGFPCGGNGGGGQPGGLTGSIQYKRVDATLGGSTSMYDPATDRTSINNLTVPLANGVAYVLPSFTRGGSDVGDEINRAYASLPATGGLIYIAPNTGGACYNYTTPIVLAVAGKIPTIVGLGTANGGTTLLPQGGLCLNYTPLTGAAITEDYMGNQAADVMNYHGISNILLINNGCHTTGGCGSSAIGLDNGNTNAGMAGATLLNVTIAGFGTGWRNVSHVAGGESQSVEMLWVNPLFFQNTTAIVIENPTGIVFMKGFFSSNGKAIVGNDSGATAEIKLYGTTFAGNQTPPIVDFTAVTIGPAALYTFGVHWETTTLDMNYVAGFLSFISTGDLFETNNKTPGGCTDIVDAKLSSKVNMTGGIMAIGGTAAPCPAIVNAETTNVNGQVQGYARGFTAVATGPGAANVRGDVYDETVSAKIMANEFLGGVKIGSPGVTNPLDLLGPANGGLWMDWGSAAPGSQFDTCGTLRSSGGTFCAYNATPTGGGNWAATIATLPTSIEVQDNNGLAFYSEPAGACPTTGTNSFTDCFGLTVFKATSAGFFLPGTATPLFLNASPGNIGQTLVSQGGLATPIWGNGVTTVTPTVGKSACIKSAGPPVVVGFCSTVVDSSGACTCN